MTAPSAPRIIVHTDGITLRVSWKPVLNATDYKLYVGSAPAPTGLEADISDDGDGLGPWLQYDFVPDDTDSYLRMTALNVGAEESAYSTEYHFNLSGNTGTSFGKAAPPKRPRNTSDPFGAL